MIYFTESDIDQLIEDDAPMGDMTTHLLDLKNKDGKITLSARQPMVVCCSEEAVRIYQKVGLQILYQVPSGTELQKDDKVLEADGDAEAIHLIWRTGSILIECASGIAGRTRQLVTLAQKENPLVTIAGTRKHPPYMKKIALKALMVGGGVPHRTGLSDSILIFREHLLFCGGYENLSDLISKVKKKQKERMVVVEAHTYDQMMMAVRAGAHAVQVDKMDTEQLPLYIKECKTLNPDVQVIVAGGINAENVTVYARSHADVIVTSWMYFAPPADVEVKISQK